MAHVPAVKAAVVPLRLRPIAPRTVEVGEVLSIDVTVEGVSTATDDLQFGLGSGAPRGAMLNTRTGRFTWTPTQSQGGAKYDVTVAVRAADGRSDQTAFGITVTGPKPLPSAQGEIAVDLGGSVKLELVLVPAGSFLMGDDKGGPDEKPAHQVNITRSFYLGKYEVTQEQWQAVMGNNPSKFKGVKNPVEDVSWNDCQAFLGKLNAKPGLQGGKFILPTEAQWEYACRAGSTTEYCFGDAARQLGEYAWYDSNSASTTHAVGEKRPNAWGLHDMHGNVWEWCADWSGSYADSPHVDPTGPSGGSFRVYRGGGWSSSYARYCRSAIRRDGSPGNRHYGLGFRVARTQ